MFDHTVMAFLAMAVFMVQQHPQVEHITCCVWHIVYSPNLEGQLIYMLLPALFCLVPYVGHRDIDIHGHLPDRYVIAFQRLIQFKEVHELHGPAVGQPLLLIALLINYSLTLFEINMQLL